jgi:hypothetical protein
MASEYQTGVEPAAPAGRRWVRWLRNIAVILLLLGAGLAAVYYLLRQASDRELAAVMAELDQQDPGWRLEEIEARRVSLPPEQNSAVRIQAVKRLLPNPWPARNTPAADAEPEAESPAAIDERVGAVEPEVQLSAALTRDLRAALQNVARAVAQARPLAEMPRGRFAVTWAKDGISTVLTCQDARAAANLLRLDAALLAQDGDPDKALASVRGILNAGRAVGDEPTLIPQFVHIALQAVAVCGLERTLAQGEPSEAALQAVQELLEKEAAEPLLLYGVRGERAVNHRTLQWMEDGGGSLSQTEKLLVGGAPGAGGQPSRLESMVSGALARRSHVPHLRLLTEFVAIARLPMDQQIPQLDALDERIMKSARAGELPVVSKLLLPAVLKVAQACQRGQAILRGAVAAVAAERYRRQHGRWPAAQAQLVQAGLLRAALVDPYDAQPLRLRPLADGIVIYSVGPDGIDDNGKIDRKNITAKGTDIGFRLWNVPQRRQAPSAKLPAAAPNGKEPDHAPGR